MGYDEELINGFIDETRDILDEVEPTLIDLTRGNANASDLDSETINSVFRLFHSLKSSAAFLGFSNIASLTHDAENVLQGVRDGIIAMDIPLITTLVKCLDIIRNMLEAIETNQNDNGYEKEIATNKKELQIYLSEEHSHNTAKEIPMKETNAISAPVEEQTQQQSVDFDDMLITDEMRLNFIAEGTEQLESVEQAFLTLERSGFDSQVMHGAYRSIHSFKGNCGFMHFNDLQEISHMLETVMEQMKDGIIKVEQSVITFMLQTIDTLRETVTSMNEGGDGSVPLLAAYKDLLIDVFPTCFSKNISTNMAPILTPVPTEIKKIEIETTASIENDSFDTPLAAEVSETQVKKKRNSIERQDIRVDLSKLDSIINLVGELVIAESMVTRNPAVLNIEDERFYRASHQLRRICNELQDASMSLRMIPLDGVFKKMIRVVHDLSMKIDKDIDLEIIGGDTEVDKTVIEQLSDPLVHIIRNSCDHGIETKEERKKSGKHSLGKITIEGRHEGGEVWIIIKDDGRGLNKEKIIAKAVKNGIIRESEYLTDNEIWRLIFHPGFSTAEQITNVSGRGVGMDVVKKNVEKLNGRIDIATSEGNGSTMTIRIPLTLAIIDGMLVQVGESKYTVPTLSIKRSLRITEEQLTHSPEGKEILLLDDKFIPIIHLGKLFDHAEAHTELAEGILIVVDDGGTQVALFADEIIGQQQTVIKGLSPYISAARGTSGCTILGDGSVALILDIRSLVGMAESMAHLDTRAVSYKTGKE